MKLSSPSHSSPEPSENSLNAQIVEQIFGVTDRKRSRPTSRMNSLEYKHDGVPKSHTTPTRERKQVEDFKKRPVEQPRQTNTVKTRARGGSGIPPHRLDLEDLQGMDEDQIMQALYEDPELAKAAAEAAEQAKEERKANRKAKTKTKASSGSSSRNKRSREQALGAPPAHLQEMMDNGVPFTQWLIIAILVGVLLYQLRKMVAEPSSRNVGKNFKAKTVDKNRSRKSKGKKNVIVSSKTSKEPNITKDVVKELTLETPKPQPQTTKVAKKKKPKKVKSIKSQAPATPKKVDDQPDSVATEGSSLEDDIVGRPVPEPTFQFLQDAPADDSGGWQEVSSKSKSSRVTKNDRQSHVAPVLLPDNGPAIEESTYRSGEEEKKIETPEEVSSPPTAPVKVSGESPDAAENTADDEKKIEDLSAKTNNHANVETPRSSTQDDEALAQQLQMEEEKKAMTNIEHSPKDDQDSWEEVGSKKKKTAR